MTRLDPPENWVLSTMNEMEVAEMLEEHICFYTEDKDGNQREVQLPMPFVRHFMNREDDLPIQVAISTAPLVMPNGRMLAPPGLDRLRGIDFIIPDDLRVVIPKRKECTPDAIRQAMAFLCDNWLVDVKTDRAGKCIIVANALAIIERSLLPQRPCFFYTAGNPRAGKTTTLQMLLMAVTGMYATESAWSPVEEERRKALLAHFMMGKPYILWDNIKRGTTISCPHIERSCTSSYYADRKLGVSELVSTAASTIHLFTGNNIAAKGDLASRSLEVRLTADRADPENRKFVHPDPLAWTNDMRAEIMQSFYILLLGNPQLREPEDAPAKTRFKMWWRLVGSAVEHAAKQIGYVLDFQTLFVARDDADEESTSLADVLGILAAKWPQEFTADELAGFVSIAVSDPNVQTLREFLSPGCFPHQTFSAVAVGKLLRKHIDAQVRCGERTLVLRARKARADQTRYTIAELAQPSTG